jgi:hypothetical protein
MHRIAHALLDPSSRIERRARSARKTVCKNSQEPVAALQRFEWTDHRRARDYQRIAGFTDAGARLCASNIGGSALIAGAPALWLR